jgi:hypothetical protein
MPETMPIADAMEEAAAVLDTETLAVIEAVPDDAPMPDAATPVQVPLFESPPFDFEQAYDELHRLDLRAKNRKAAWESLKGATRDAKEDYDSAINDLHDKFDEIDSARRVAAAVRQNPTPTREGGGDAQMGEPEEVTEIDTPEPESETPASETSTDAPSD